MTATIPCKECPYVKTCIARLNDKTVSGCGVALFTNGLINYDEIGVEHTVNVEKEMQTKSSTDNTATLCDNCPHKTDTCQEGLHCPMDE